MAMGDSLLADLVGEAFSMHIDGDWNNARLYMPYTKGQSLLYESADCLASQTFLKMAQLPVQVVQRPNAEFISPTGEVPLLQMDKLLVPGFNGIVDLVRKKNASLSGHLTEVEYADMVAHIAVIDHILRNVEEYLVWMHNDTYTQVTRSRFGSVYKWPLSVVLPTFKRRQVTNKLADNGWAHKSLPEVIEQADKALRILSSRLGTQDYLTGSRPTEVDALVFGHLYAILTTRLPTMDLLNALKKYTNLVEYAQRIENEYFK